jgi:hypothetical protein
MSLELCQNRVQLAPLVPQMVLRPLDLSMAPGFDTPILKPRSRVRLAPGSFCRRGIMASSNFSACPAEMNVRKFDKASRLVRCCYLGVRRKRMFEVEIPHGA